MYEILVLVVVLVQAINMKACESTIHQALLNAVDCSSWSGHFCKKRKTWALAYEKCRVPRSILSGEDHVEGVSYQRNLGICGFDITSHFPSEYSRNLTLLFGWMKSSRQ